MEAPAIVSLLEFKMPAEYYLRTLNREPPGSPHHQRSERVVLPT